MEHGSRAALYEHILKLRNLLEGDSELKNIWNWIIETHTMIYKIYYLDPSGVVHVQQLYDIYNKLKERGEPFEVFFISSDKTHEDF